MNTDMIYRHILMPVLEFYGLWNQIRMDHGIEFVLTNFVQRHLSSQRLRETQPAVLQTSSSQNHKAERLWSEVNQRINYPVKRLLIQLQEDGIINMHDECTKFLVFWVTNAVVTPATKAFVSSWNLHKMQGRGGGIPLVLASMRNFTSSLSHIPTVQECIWVKEVILFRKWNLTWSFTRLPLTSSIERARLLYIIQHLFFRIFFIPMAICFLIVYSFSLVLLKICMIWLDDIIIN